MNNITNKEKCANCKYFISRKDYHTVNNIWPFAITVFDGLCRKEPPIVIKDIMSQPAVCANDWCSHYMKIKNKNISQEKQTK
jgi:hypothetical protein